VAEGGISGVFCADDGAAGWAVVNEVGSLVFVLEGRLFCMEPPGETGDLRDSGADDGSKEC